MSANDPHGTPAAAAMARFQDLFVVLEDLIKRVADTDDPTIRHMRADVRAKLVRLESEPALIAEATHSPSGGRAPAAEIEQAGWRRDRSWAKPVLAALTSAAVAVTLLTPPQL